MVLENPPRIWEISPPYYNTLRHMKMKKNPSNQSQRSRQEASPGPRSTIARPLPAMKPPCSLQRVLYNSNSCAFSILMLSSHLFFLKDPLVYIISLSYFLFI
uniref:Uncharacterized protein n=1 Tax=Kalanchoe fedtschenkoi TaxID=63787 RepID=A0A7N0UKD0_KALFE